MNDWNPNLEGVAIVGMAGRFPGARSVDEFWKNQLEGVEAISQFRVEDLEIPNAAEISKDPDYVRARGVLDDADLFDADFFAMHAREAELTDPQHRLFLESCWQALEDAGYDPGAYPGAIGVYAGSSPETYFYSRLCAKPGFIDEFTSGYQVGNYAEMLANSRDFIATRVSYKLNLRGPSFTIQAGCSTSLITVTQACQALLAYQCDMALAGGSSITFPQKRGSYYQDGGMVSPDGHCRTFDAEARGTVFGSGVAVVVLKRLDEAVRDGDHVYAVIRGFAANNDGAAKVGFTAPSVEGQARVIAMAQAAAGVSPGEIGYIEAHGTATALGDPIELAALTQAFRAHTNRKRFCAIGTAKTNVGHLDVAAGVTGLIHAAEIIRNGEFPRTLQFSKPNPKFDFENSPFYVNTERTPWKQDKGPRRAGVSSFGIGGTNAHVVLEQAPEQASPPPLRPAELLVVSARSGTALDRATNDLAEYLEDHPELNLEDVAWTLQIGRRAFSHRRAIAARDAREAIASLRERNQSDASCKQEPQICFLFPGQGSQFPNMGRELYGTEPVFRDTVDRCAELLEDELAMDLRQVLYPPGGASDQVTQSLSETLMAQPAIFTVEYALAHLWMSWNIRPQAMIGHSIGEFVAACLSDVFSLEDALRLVAARARMMQKLPPGRMLSVRLSEEELRARLTGHLSLAAINAPRLCVVAGPFEALDHLEHELTSEGVPTRRLATSHAFHSAMMDPIIEPFAARVAGVQLNAPKLPYMSGVTGAWITPEQATDPRYWVRHFRQPVQFSAGMKLLRETANTVLLEVGPGNALTTLARQHAGLRDQVIVPSMPDRSSPGVDTVALLDALGALWTRGVQPNWRALYHGTQRQRVSLPTYPFERKRCWLELPRGSKPSAGASVAIGQHTDSSRVGPSEVTHQVKAPPVPAVAARADRRTQISSMISATFEDLSGRDLSQANASTTFLEMGFDSLFLTQVTQTLQRKFGLKIAFRQLLGEQSTLNSLGQYIDSKLPDTFAASPAVQQRDPVDVTSADRTAGAVPLPAAISQASVSLPATANDGSASTPETSIERMMREQIRTLNELFAKQLETLRNVHQRPPASSVEVSAERSSAAQTKTARLEPSRSQASTGETEHTRELKGYTPFKALESGSSNLTARQRDYISSLVARYTRRTAGSKRRTHEYRQVLADPRVVSGFRLEWKEMVYPIVALRSQGAHLWDIDGNEYVDILNGFGPIMLGHRPEFVERAIEKQLHEGFEIGPQTALAGEVAQLVSEFTGNERVTFCNTGSEAVIAAMRVARTVTARSKIVLFAGDYHGMFDEVLVKGFTKAGVPHAVPSAPGIPGEKVANVIVLEYGSAESLEWIRANANELAAVLVEPVQSRHPALQPIPFLKEIREITEQSGTCFIFDEVVTGFRVHPGGCQALFHIRADLATYGKVLAGGMPIGVLAGKAQYMDALDGGMWQFGDESYPSAGVTFFAGTFVRHPLTMAAAKAVLHYLKEQGPELQEDLNKRTTALVGRLNEILTRYGVPTQIESFGSIFYFSFPASFRFGSLFYYHLREKGVHVLEGFPCFLTTAHTEADLERVVRAFEEAAREMRAGGVLPVAEEEVPLVEAATARDSVGEAPMTEPQREIFLAATMGDDASCSFNESFSLHLRGRLQIDALHESLHHVVNRHDALRSIVDPDGTKLHFRRDLALDVRLRDLTPLEKTAREGEFRRILDEDARRPFDLVNGPLVRAELVRFEPEYHILLFTSHHIVCDGWSTNILLEELCASYTARCAGQAAQLDSPVSFASYAERQFESRGSPEHDDTEAYWLGQFKDIPAPLDLPLDRPRQMVRTYRGATYRTHVGSETYSKAKQIGSKLGCTPFVTLLTAFATLLYRLSKQDDIVIGIPTAGQSLLENGNLVGHCVHFLPLRTRFRDDLPVSELLQSVGKTLLDAHDHQSYTYGTLVRKLAIQRDPSRLPLIEVQFNLERIGGKLEFEGVEASVDPNPKGAVNFDIFFNVVESDRGLTIDCDYNTDLFDETTISRWMGHYETLLEGMARNVQQPVSELPLLSDGERRQLLVGWNATAADYPRSKCVHRLIEEQVNRAPENVALKLRDEALTYAELDGRSSQLANYLGNLGVGPGNLVGIATERTSEMLVALLGTWKTGAAYVPLDPTHPRERLASILDQTQASVLVTHSPLRAQLPRFDGRLICLDKDKELIERESQAAPKLTHDSGSTAYVIFTSGSTGTPKGVEVTHRSVVNVLWSMQAKPGFTENDRLLAVTTLSFDIAALELFLPLVCGGTVLIADRETAADGRLMQDEISRFEPTVMQATPATWRLLLEAGWKGTPGMKILCGGEAPARALADRLVECGEVWNMYGPTETTIWSATCRLEKGSGPVTFGEPIANTQFYVLDSRKKPVPIGVPGELYIGGEGVARGYFNQPDLTAERFVLDPFANQVAHATSPRMFKTGDLVRYRPDGRLEFLGRLDHQVKIRGFRIELEEIEAALARHPAIRECVVTATEHEPGTSKLVAYFIANDSESPHAGDLRDWLAGSLPAYAVPSLFVPVAAFPKTPNGKTDRKALPAPDGNNARASRSFVAPRTLPERELARICAEVLDLEQVSIDDSLFHLGADSIHIFQIVARANRAGIAISPQHVLKLQTIRALASALNANGNGNAKADPAPIPRVAREPYRLEPTPRSS